MFSEHRTADTYAREIIRLSQEELITVMPYMDRVLLNIPVIFHDPKQDPEAEIQFGTDGKKIHTFAWMIIETYMSAPEQISRMLFHSLLHCLFNHMYQCNDLDEQIWNLSTDIAAESIILDLNLDALKVHGDERRINLLSDLFPTTMYRNAESIYAYLQKHPDIRDKAMENAWLFQQDRHDLWYTGQNAKTKKTDRLRKAVEQAAENYENSRGLKPGSVTRKLHLQITETRDYSELLKRFLRNTEEIRTDPDSFDTILYTYGLQKYHNLPLIEPLEYQEDNHIHELVIAIDTSASCNGRKIRTFLQETRNVLASEEFGKNMNVRIIQCDAVIQEEIIIHSLPEYDDYLQDMTVKGYGGTDFRPVFARIDAELQNGAFHDLRGLIYFTDGNGTYPEESPAYPVAFVMSPSNEQKEINVPSWAIRMNINGETE